MRERFARVFLAAALVVSQYGVHAHALSHLDEALYGQDGGVPPDHELEVCVAFVAASGGAATSPDPPLAAARAANGFVAAAPADPLLPPLALTRFASRAPPLPV
jgi:hypothetical protein